MKKSIFKYPLDVTDYQEKAMPIGAEILCVQTQNEVPCIWALVDPAAGTEMRNIETFGTGHPVHCDMGVERKYIGTFQLRGGELVFHVFERIN